MYLKKLTVDTKVNASLQVGDVIYFQTPSTYFQFNTIDSANMKRCGKVHNVTGSVITVDVLGSIPEENDFLFFVKNGIVNKSSLLGYYAGVRFENNSKVKAEMFSVGSSLVESSK